MVNIRIISQDEKFDFPYGEHTTLICQKVGGKTQITASIGCGGVVFGEYEEDRAKKVIREFRLWVDNSVAWAADALVGDGNFMYYKFPKE